MMNSMANHSTRISMKLVTALTVLIGTAVTSTQASSDLDARAGHPLGGPLAINNVHKRSCAVRPYGCEKGYCWQKCNQDGSWCWLALERGNGDWVHCVQNSDCGPDPFRDSACAICNNSSWTSAILNDIGGYTWRERKEKRGDV